VCVIRGEDPFEERATGAVETTGRSECRCCLRRADTVSLGSELDQEGNLQRVMLESEALRPSTRAFRR